MIIDIKIITILLFLAFILGMILFTPISQWIQGLFNSISSATAPVANALNSTSDNSLCHVTGLIGC